MGDHPDRDLFIQKRMPQFFLFSVPPCSEDRPPAFVVQIDGGRFVFKILFRKLSSVEHRQSQTVAQGRAEFFHQIQRERSSSGPERVQIPRRRIQPDRFESGTINTAGAISLGAGVDFVNSKGIGNIRAHENALCRRFFEGMAKQPSVKLYSAGFDERFAPVIPFNIGDLPAEKASQLLSDAGFALRGGFHCAYPAHKKIGTPEQGAVRFSPSVFNTMTEVNALVRAVGRIATRYCV